MKKIVLLLLLTLSNFLSLEAAAAAAAGDPRRASTGSTKTTREFKPSEQISIEKKGHCKCDFDEAPLVICSSCNAMLDKLSQKAIRDIKKCDPTFLACSKGSELIPDTEETHKRPNMAKKSVTSTRRYQRIGAGGTPTGKTIILTRKRFCNPETEDLKGLSKVCFVFSNEGEDAEPKHIFTFTAKTFAARAEPLDEDTVTSGATRSGAGTVAFEKVYTFSEFADSGDEDASHSSGGSAAGGAGAGVAAAAAAPYRAESPRPVSSGAYAAAIGGDGEGLPPAPSRDGAGSPDGTGKDKGLELKAPLLNDADKEPVRKGDSRRKKDDSDLSSSRGWCGCC